MLRIFIGAMVLFCFSCGMRQYTSNIRLRPVENTEFTTAHQEEPNTQNLEVFNPSEKSSKEDSLTLLHPNQASIPADSYAEVMHSKKYQAPEARKKKPVTEKRIRSKGFGSIGIGVVSSGSVASGLVLFFGGTPLGLLLILGGAILAFLGMKLALSAQRDADTLTARSTMAWLRRPARIGGTINVIVLLVSGLIAFLTLISLAF
jgi:hypothetical protein